MKRIILIIFLAILSAYDINAQEIKFGVKAGVNFATITGDATDNVDTRTDFHIGAVVEIPLFDKLSLQPEWIYSSQGAVDMDDKLKLDYINLPVMVKFYVLEWFSLETGPQVGLLMGEKLEVDGQSEEISEYTSSIDFGFNFGLGFKLENGLNFAARYNLGLTNIWDFEDSNDLKNQNNVIQLSIGYMF